MHRFLVPIKKPSGSSSSDHGVAAVASQTPTSPAPASETRPTPSTSVPQNLYNINVIKNIYQSIYPGRYQSVKILYDINIIKKYLSIYLLPPQPQHTYIHTYIYIYIIIFINYVTLGCMQTFFNCIVSHVFKCKNTFCVTLVLILSFMHNARTF